MASRITVLEVGGDPHGEILFEIGELRYVRLSGTYMHDLTGKGRMADMLRRNMTQQIKEIESGQVLRVEFERSGPERL